MRRVINPKPVQGTAADAFQTRSFNADKAVLNTHDYIFADNEEELPTPYLDKLDLNFDISVEADVDDLFPPISDEDMRLILSTVV